MAVDLNKFKNKVEKRLPLLFLVEESSMSYDFAGLIEVVLDDCLKKNIHTEFMVISFGLDWKLIFPKLKENDAPFFVGLESIDTRNILSAIREIPKSRQTFLGSALELSKAVLDDPETMKSDRYKPIVFIITSREPAKGWELPFENLLENGRSSSAQIYWVNSPEYNSVLISEQIDKLGDFLKKYKKVVYKQFSSDWTSLSAEIVSSFKLEPLDEVPAEAPVEFTNPDFNGDFGDGTEAKGDGVV